MIYNSEVIEQLLDQINDIYVTAVTLMHNGKQIYLTAKNDAERQIANEQRGIGDPRIWHKIKTYKDNYKKAVDELRSDLFAYSSYPIDRLPRLIKTTYKKTLEILNYLTDTLLPEINAVFLTIPNPNGLPSGVRYSSDINVDLQKDEIDYETCAICGDDIAPKRNDDYVRLTCNHMFCTKCFQQYRADNTRCPICRTPF